MLHLLFEQGQREKRSVFLEETEVHDILVVNLSLVTKYVLRINYIILSIEVKKAE